MTSSAIYEVELRHRRWQPRHELRQRLRLAYLDLDELPAVLRARRGWSTRPAPVWFRRRDYLDGGDGPLRDAIADLVEERGRPRPRGPVRILTQLRTFGWLFNPLTTYYCFEPDGHRLATVVLEVTNTPWHERFWYVLSADQVTGRGVRIPKAFHVSPFLPLDLSYRCRVTPPAERLALRFELSVTGVAGRSAKVFDADLTGHREAIDAPFRFRTAVRAATQTFRVSAGIYAHAAALGTKGARLHRHPDAAKAQPRRLLDPVVRRSRCKR